MRVFIGVANTANMGYIYKKGFNELGFLADLFERNPHPFYSNVGSNPIFHFNLLLPIYDLYHKEDVCPLENEPLLSALESFLANQNLLNYDIYIFINAETILPGNLDLPILKRNCKKIVSIFSGSEVRESETALDLWHDFSMEYTLPYINTYPLSHPITLREIMFANIYTPSMFKKLYQILMAESFADAILSVPEQSALQSSPYYPYIHAVDTDSLIFNITSNSTPNIVHIPSNPKVKRSDIILKALDEIKKEGVEFNLIAKTRIPHSEVKEILSEADIVIDQLNVFPALLSHESMGSGCAVLTGVNPLGLPIPLDEYQCPAINVTQYNIKDVAKKLILDRDMSLEFALMGRDYIMSYCTPKKAVERIISYLDRSEKGDYDYYPSYFFKKLKIDGRNAHPVINYLLKKALVKNGVPDMSSKEHLKKIGLLDTSFNNCEITLWHQDIIYLSDYIAIKA